MSHAGPPKVVVVGELLVDPRLLLLFLVFLVFLDILDDEDDRRYHASDLDEEEGVGLPDKARSVRISNPHPLILSPPAIWV